MATLTDAVALSRTRARPRTLPIAEPLLAWFMVAASAWFIGGVYLDGWAHNHGKVDDSFFTPWHGVLYSGYGATAGVLLAALFRNRAAGLSWRRALPDGYAVSLFGALVFAVGGVGDLLWHTVFGIETGTEALLSPTHLSLALGGSLMAAGPLRAAWRRIDTPPAGWLGWLPVLLSATVLMSFITFMSQFAHPFIWPQAGTADAPPVGAASNVFVMNADGSGQHRLTRLSGQAASQATWAPDGRGLALVVSDPRSKTTSLAIASADGVPSRTLLSGRGDSAPSVPVLSPDGERVAFVSAASTGLPELYVVDVASGAQRQLTNGGVAFSRPAWSPDGQKILFVAESRLTIVDVATGQVGAVPNGNAAGTGSWSPDGSRIAFGSDRTGAWQIHAMNIDGSDARQLTDARRPSGRHARSWYPTWSPDGSQIAFMSDRNGNIDVFVMQSDGSRQANLTDNPSLDSSHPAWSPDGRQITFTAAGHTTDPDLPIAYSIAGILVQGALLTGLVLVLARRWRMPFGAFTLVFTLNATLISFQNDTYVLIVAAALGGLCADLLLRQMRPFESNRARNLHVFAFAVPALLYAAYFAALTIDQGLIWSVHLWAGSIVVAGISGWLLSYLVAPLRAHTA